MLLLLSVSISVCCCCAKDVGDDDNAFVLSSASSLSTSCISEFSRDVPLDRFDSLTLRFLILLFLLLVRFPVLCSWRDFVLLLLLLLLLFSTVWSVVVSLS